MPFYADMYNRSDKTQTSGRHTATAAAAVADDDDADADADS
jgi:hypothetical protein